MKSFLDFIVGFVGAMFIIASLVMTVLTIATNGHPTAGLLLASASIYALLRGAAYVDELHRKTIGVTNER